MNFVFQLLTLLNLFGLIYLVFLFYRRAHLQNRNSPTIPLDTTKNIKLNLVRFNPFEGVGGDQSFILCLLDNSNSGVIITSLHNRSFTRVYAKAIRHGECDNSALSREESKCLLKTINS